MDDELRKPIKWDRPCYKCRSYYCDQSCPALSKNANAAPPQPAVWMQSDHLNKFIRKFCGSASMLARCSDHQLMADYQPLYTAPVAAQREWVGLVEALHEARRARGEHIAPEHCYTTGPTTGDPYRDLVECPACSFITKYDAALKEKNP